MGTIQLHRRQFVVNNVPRHPEWATYLVAPETYLHAHPDLRITRAMDAEGGQWYLLGTAVPARTDQAIVMEIAQTATAGVWAASDGWAGRWVLIGDGQIGLDSAGMLGVFYNPITCEASSSPALLKTGAALHEIQHSDPWNWYAPPFSRFAGVYRLLPSQRLNLDTFSPLHRPLLVPLPERTYEETLDELEAVLKRTVNNMAELGQVIMPLTGGNDSRLILSLLVATGHQPETYTLGHNTKMSTADRELPPRIAERLNLKHAFIQRPAVIKYPEAPRLYQEQSAGHAIEQDQHYIAYGQFDHLTDNHVILNGGGFEIGRQFYKRLPSSPMHLGPFGRLPDSTREALARFEEWMKEHPEPMDWRDRLYWEQRLGGWISACGLGTDMLPGVRLPPANCRYTMSLLLSLPRSVRAQSKHHADLVARLTPSLKGIPFNPPEPLAERLSELPGKVARRVRRILSR